MIFEILFISIVPVLLIALFMQWFYYHKIIKEWENLYPNKGLWRYEKAYGTKEYAYVEFIGFTPNGKRFMNIRTNLNEVIGLTPLQWYFSGWK